MTKAQFMATLPDRSNRVAILQWLLQNDHNGIYTDERNAAEGNDPLTLSEAQSLLQAVIDDVEASND